LEEASRQPERIPDHAYDCHTFKGKEASKTREQFFHE